MSETVQFAMAAAAYCSGRLLTLFPRVRCCPELGERVLLFLQTILHTRQSGARRLEIGLRCAAGPPFGSDLIPARIARAGAKFARLPLGTCPARAIGLNVFDPNEAAFRSKRNSALEMTE